MIKLSDSEWEIMEVFWEKGEISLSTTLKELHKKEIPWAQNTVHTMITRLAKKGAITIIKEARPFKYEPCISKEACELKKADSILNQAFDGSITKMVSTLIGNGRITDEEITKLQELIKHWQGGE